MGTPLIDYRQVALAHVLTARRSERLAWSDWVVEEKLDGHRMMVAVGAYNTDLFGRRSVFAWSRNGITRSLPQHVVESCGELSNGLYDGELITTRPHTTHYDVRQTTAAADLRLVLFDILDLEDGTSGRVTDVTGLPWTTRRRLLERVFTVCGPDPTGVGLVPHQPAVSRANVDRVLAEVLARGGEGVMLKHTYAAYPVGRRTPAWLKLKVEKSAVLTLVGFQAGRTGPRSIMIGRDAEGNVTTVKWKTLALLAEIDAAPDRYLGRRFLIEFQERTHLGGYRHPRFDRWAGDGDQEVK